MGVAIGAVALVSPEIWATQLYPFSGLTVELFLGYQKNNSNPTINLGQNEAKVVL